MITLTSKRKCDARCWNAKSKTCSCACGGRHHGMPPMPADAVIKPSAIALEGTVVLAVQFEHENYYETLIEKRIPVGA